MAIQLDFFEKDEITILKDDFRKVKDSCDRVRKKQFAELGEMKKEVSELKEMVRILVEAICKTKM
jgi:hypothetical protein